MPSCAATNCVNRTGNKNDLSFHRVPTNNKKELRSKWLQNIKRQHPLPSGNSFFICSDHFEEDCFERDFMVRFCCSLHKIPYFYLIFWCGNFLETQFPRSSPETLTKLGFHKIFPQREFKWNFGILHSYYSS